MRGSHGLPPSLLGPIWKERFRRQTVPHTVDLQKHVQHASQRFSGSLFHWLPSRKLRIAEATTCPVHHAERDGYFWLRQ